MSILDDLRTIYDKLNPPLYYVITDQIAEGEVLMVSARDIYPEVWLIHPWDFAEHGAELSTYARLVDYRTWRPSQEDLAKAARLSL